MGDILLPSMNLVLPIMNLLQIFQYKLAFNYCIIISLSQVSLFQSESMDIMPN